MNIDWNKHWIKSSYDPLLNINNPKIWSDFVWMHSIKFIEYRIEEHMKFCSKNKISFLECGAGTASVSRYVKFKYGFTVTALDNEIESVKLIKELSLKDKLEINTIYSDLNKIPLEENSIDIIYLGGVLEYVSDLDSAMIEIKRVLKDEGLLIFMVVPNTINIQIIGNIFMSLKSLLYNNDQKKLVPNNARKSRSFFYQKLLINHDFEKIQINFLTPFIQLPLPNIFKKLYAKILILSEGIIKRINKSNFLFKEYFTISFLISAKKSKL